MTATADVTTIAQMNGARPLPQQSPLVRLENNLETVIRGKSQSIRLLLIGLLAGGHVVQAMKEGFFNDPGSPLQERLLSALEYGRDAGGQGAGAQRLPERSASLTVVDRRNVAEWDIRVDLHPTAVEELRAIYERFKPYQPYYNDRDTDPSRCLPQAQWEKAFLVRPAS